MIRCPRRQKTVSRCAVFPDFDWGHEQPTFRELVQQAHRRALASRRHDNAVERSLRGPACQAPFDRILVAAACERPPMRLLHQLPEGGLLVAPIEIGESAQRLTVFCRRGQRITTRDAGAVRMPAIVSGTAQSP